MKLSVIILAAGQGTRMKSAMPKVLHCVAGKPMLEHVIDTAQSLGAEDIHVVYGHGGEQVKSALSHKGVNWVVQEQQLGTGHAVQQVSEHLKDDQTALILYGDVPLITKETLSDLLESVATTQLAVLTAIVEDPTGYGRIVRDSSNYITRIVEQKDANPEDQKINEINTGIIAANACSLKAWLEKLDSNNAQNEFYLTDVIAMASNDGQVVESAQAQEFEETLGVNNRMQLANLERYHQAKIADKLMRDGVTLLDPQRIDIRGNVEIGNDTIIDINVVIEGETKIGSGVKIGAGAHITNAAIGDGVEVLPYSVIENAQIGESSRVGPFARLRPGTELSASVHIGNFVEVKNAQIAEGSKVNHLSYVGDSTVGKKVNIGAGTITCNYDGANKHRTVIEDSVFVGSDTQLVAPVTVGEGATIGAGTTVTKNVPAGSLVISRAPQKVKAEWKRPVKKAK